MKLLRYGPTGAEKPELMRHLNSEIATIWSWYKELLSVCDRCELSRFWLRDR